MSLKQVLLFFCLKRIRLLKRHSFGLFTFLIDKKIYKNMVQVRAEMVQGGDS